MEKESRNETFALQQSHILSQNRNLVLFGMFLDSMMYWIKKFTFQINVLKRYLKSLLKIKLASVSVGYLCGLMYKCMFQILIYWRHVFWPIIYNKSKWKMQPKGLKNLPEEHKWNTYRLRDGKIWNPGIIRNYSFKPCGSWLCRRLFPSYYVTHPAEDLRPSAQT